MDSSEKKLCQDTNPFSKGHMAVAFQKRKGQEQQEQATTAHTHTRMLAHACTHTHMHAQTRMHALTCMHARTHTHACTHTHTRTHIYQTISEGAYIYSTFLNQVRAWFLCVCDFVSAQQAIRHYSCEMKLE